MKYTKVGRPCKTFSALSAIRIIDPKDNTEKLAFVSISQGAHGMLVIADFDAKAFESYPLVIDSGAWALLQLPEDGSLVLGTSNYYGSVQRFDMMEREWYEPLRIETEEYIWNFALGTDGNVYGGTWSGDKLLRYCPKTHTLDDMGKVSAEADNNYARMVYSEIPGKIIISSQFGIKRITSYDIATGQFDRNLFPQPGNVFWIEKDYLCSSNDITLQFLNPLTGERLIDREFPAKGWEEFAQEYPLVARMKGAYYHEPKNFMFKLMGDSFSCVGAYMDNGDLVGVQGQELFRLRKGSKELEFVDITSEPPAAFIHELIAGDDGKLWGASSFGMTIFSYDPKTGEEFNTRSITTAGGEVYGMVSHDHKIYSTAYSWGEHVVYDPQKPWQGRENINPKNVRTLWPKYLRPFTKSKIDSDGYIWTGWMEEYGVRGMAISKWDTKTDTVELFEHLVPRTSVFGLDITEDYVWFTTCNHANGLPDIDAPLSLCAIDKEGNLVFRKNFDEGVHVGRIAFAGRYGVVQAGKYLYRIDSKSLQVTRLSTVELSWYKTGHIETIIRYNEDTVAVFDMEETIFIKPETGEVTARVSSPKGNPKELFFHGVFAAAVLDGTVYASVGADLYRLEE